MGGKNAIRDTFFEECEDLLEALSDGLAALDSGAGDDETVNAVFRAVHSMKGGAGAFGLDALVAFAHRFETVLDAVRSHRLAMSTDLITVLLSSSDMLSDLVDAARNEAEVDADARSAMIAQLETFLTDEEAEGPAEAEVAFTAVSLAFELDLGDAADPAGADRFRIAFHPAPALYANGHEPALLFAALEELGDLEVTLDHSAVPPLAELEPGQSFLGWTAELATEASEAAVWEVFEFVEGLCTLEITRLDATGPDDAGAIAALPDPQFPQDAGEGPSEAARAPDVAAAAGPAPDPVPAAAAAPPPAPAAERPAADKPAADKPAPDKPAPDKPREKERHGPAPTLRVDLERVDRLINTVGELIINQAMIAQRIAELDLPPGTDVANDLEDYKLLARDIQEGVMAIRAQPVKPLFQRMSRIVREAAAATGKQARMVAAGEATEVDKTVIERLADPLTHMIRNAVDHGLETPERRLELGKPEIGTITHLGRPPLGQCGDRDRRRRCRAEPHPDLRDGGAQGAGRGRCRT